eukprot:Hpha_TRINITY_DN16850_c1_g15::TRINITY_DN16850_c1_g15_i1::g.153112::m.153112
MGGIETTVEGAQPLPCSAECVEKRIRAAGERVVRDTPGLSAEAWAEAMRPLDARTAATEFSALLAEGNVSHHRPPPPSPPLNPTFVSQGSENFPFDSSIGLLSMGRMAPDAIWPVVVPPPQP